MKEETEYVSMIDACVSAMIICIIDEEIEKATGISMLKELKQMKKSCKDR